MPNHIKNIVKIDGIRELPIFTEIDGDDCFDFTKILPMPKELELEAGGIEDIAVKAAILKVTNICRFSLGFKPVENNIEEEIKLRLLYNPDMSRKDLEEIGLKYVTNAILHNSMDWYDWCIKNWGTKWNSYYNQWLDDDKISFCTAWSAPIPILEKLAEIYSDRRIEIWWADEDMGFNTGYGYWYNGLADVCYYDSCSQEAYENYVECWGETECLYKDDDGIWHRRDCKNCNGCC